jgi:hypothetical protein
VPAGVSPFVEELNTMMIKKAKVMVLSALCVLAAIAATFARQVDIPWFTIDGGGGTTKTTDGVFELCGTIGQPDAGTLTAGSFTLSGGLRVRLATPDIDGDGDVDLDDFAEFAPCQAGPDGSLPEGCGSRDLDGDADVDLKDFSNFQKSFTGQS